MKLWTKTDWMLLTLVISSFVISLLLAPKLPDIVPTHWGFSGEIDGWGSKWINLLLSPSIALLILLGMAFMPKIDPLFKSYKEFEKEYINLRSIFVIFFLFFHAVLLYNSFYPSVNLVPKAIPLGIGIFIGYIGYIMPKFKRNWFVGIKTAWTISSQKSWDATHNLGGKLFMLAGAIGIISTLFAPKFTFILFLTAILFAGIIPIIYSYYVWKEDKGKIS